MPETLLALYQNSDAIHIARFDKAEDGEISEQTDDYTAISIKKHFSISSTLKGDSRKFFVLDQVDYRYKSTDKSEEMEDPDEIVKLNAGDTLLLFLKKGEDEEGLQLTDYRDGTKKLSAADIGVYEARIKELNAIFRAEKVDEFEIVRWLIRCAEDKVTRWEGTFEMLQSVQSSEWKEKEVERRDEMLKRGEALDPEEAAEPDKPGVFVTGTTIFAKILEANQKQALSNLLLDRPLPNKDEAVKTEIAGDAELIELVQRWGDARLPAYLLDQLRAGLTEPYVVSQLMNSIAGILGDGKLSKFAEKYGEISYEDASAEVPEAAQPEGVPSGVEKVISVDELPAAEPENAETLIVSEKEAVDEETVAAKKTTYKELRQEILAKFLERSVETMAKKQQENDLAEAASSNP
ncbi:MAG: hypothetical protein WKF92_04365 [Pyrinomonadaceae bacterium]